MRIKKKNITFTIDQTRKVSDIIVSISIKFDSICSHCLNSLKSNCSSDNILHEGAESACLAYALFESIQSKLTFSALELFKTKVSSLECYAINSYFTITFNTQGTISSLRKVCGIVLSTFNPIKLYAKYSENIRFLSNKPGDRNEFNFLVKKLGESIKKDIYITTIGKINFTKDRVEDALDIIFNKIPDIEFPSAKEVTNLTKHEKYNEKYYIIKCTGITAVSVADYIRANGNGINVSVTNNGVVIYNTLAESKVNQLKDTKRIKDYVEKKYDKLEDRDEFTALFSYFALSQGFADSYTSAQIITSKLKPEQLIELIKKAL